MSATIVDGKAIARRVKEEVAARTSELISKGVTPGLAVILFGDDRASSTYVRSKRRACRRAGIHSELQHLPEATTQSELLERIGELNSREEIDGILVQTPLPRQIDTLRVMEAIDPAKDVDGFHPTNVGKLTIGEEVFVPATPLGIIEILRSHGIEIEGARALIIGRSDIVGKPLALLLMHRHATVTICHSRTRAIDAMAREADILVTAIGRAAMVTPEYVKPGAAVIDVGINSVTEENTVIELFGEDSDRLGGLRKKGYTLVGDVHPSVAEVAGLLTPVPGGVGPLTIAMLLQNCLKAARMRRGGGVGGGVMGVFLDAGLTGGISSGKSTVLRLFANLECFTLDADAIYHELIQTGRPLYEKIVDWLGPAVLDGRMRIDRVVLGEIVFGDDEALKTLNSIAHPMVVEEQERRKAEIMAENSGGIIVTDAALMIEAGTFERYDKLVVVHCDPERQIRRLMLRTRLDEESARKRIAAQMPAREKLRYADYVINNDESIEALKREVEEVYNYLVLDLRKKERDGV